MKADPDEGMNIATEGGESQPRGYRLVLDAVKRSYGWAGFPPGSAGHLGDF